MNFSLQHARCLKCVYTSATASPSGGGPLAMILAVVEEGITGGGEDAGWLEGLRAALPGAGADARKTAN